MPTARFSARPAVRSANAHTRANYNYSSFHQSLLHENNGEDYALRHLYSLENTKILLTKWGWSAEQVKTGIDHATIDVYKNVVYLHIVNKIEKRKQIVKIRGISRFISKIDYVDVLIERCWAKADPYKLEPGSDWDELIARGNTGDFYEVKLYQHEITCTCHAYSGIEKAFEQDSIATKHLMLNAKTQGQIPDKHIFAAWKYIGAETQRQYEYCWLNRRDAAVNDSGALASPRSRSVSQRASARGKEWEFDPEPQLETEALNW